MINIDTIAEAIDNRGNLMTALNDLYELKHVMKDFDQKPMENVYFYRLENENPGGLPQAQDLADTWQADILSLITPTLSTFYETSEIRVRNLFDPGDSYVKSLSITGSRNPGGSEQQPSFLAAVASASSSNGLVRKGRKMFCGLLESDQANGVFTGLGLVPFAIRAACWMAYIGDLLGGAKKWAPVIVKRVRTGTPGNYVYRLPETQIEAIFGYVQAAVVSAVVSAQDTRKR